MFIIKKKFNNIIKIIRIYKYKNNNNNNKNNNNNNNNKQSNFDLIKKFKKYWDIEKIYILNYNIKNNQKKYFNK